MKPHIGSSLPMCGFIAQLVEHHTGIEEVTGSNPVEALIFFFRLLYSNCLIGNSLRRSHITFTLMYSQLNDGNRSKNYDDKSNLKSLKKNIEMHTPGRLLNFRWVEGGCSICRISELAHW